MKIEIESNDVHEFTSDEKLAWFGYGEWVEEPDIVKFTHKGFKCWVIRGLKKEVINNKIRYSGGYLIGYIPIPKENVLFSREKLLEIDCHGGVKLLTDEKEKQWLLSFDCTHPQDLIPSIHNNFDGNTQTYKNIEFCMNECVHIVEQLLVLEQIEKEKYDEQEKN